MSSQHPSRKRPRTETTAADEAIALVEAAALAAEQAQPRAGGVDEWRAVILTCFDRWGINKGAVALAKILPGKQFARAVAAAKAQTTRLRKRLAERAGSMRVQAQRIICGPSLLTITRSRCPVHATALDALLATAIHPAHGIEGFAIAEAEVTKTPRPLPANLQPALPVHPVREVDATAINALMASIYRSIAGDDGAPPAVAAFVRRHALGTASGRQRFGDLPSTWTDGVTFRTVMPDVPPNGVILWNTWHATGGARPQTGAKMVAFMDMVPKRFLEEAGDGLFEWYTYTSTHAATDPGAGSSRGAWQATANQLRTGATTFGIDVTNWEKTGNPNALTDAQRGALAQTGYVVVEPPADLQAAAGAHASRANFDAFFCNVSGFPIDTAAVDGPASIEALFADPHKRCRLRKVDPERPLAVGGLERSGTAQGGGAFVTQSVGMGSGTTYCNEPAHVRFQLSQWMADIMASAGGGFYRNTPLVPVWERFRVKGTAAWTKGTHVDTQVTTMIPLALL